MEIICETTGHKFTPRHQRTYKFPYGDKRVDGPDFPIMMVCAAFGACLIGSIAGIVNKALWVMYAPSTFMVISIIIYMLSRFNKEYIYDICTKCGETKSP